MKWIIAILLLASSVRADVVDDGPNLNISAVNQQAHIGVSYALMMTSTLMLQRGKVKNPYLWGALFTLGVGAIKNQFINQYWSGGDFQADILGMGLGSMMTFAITF